MVGLSSLLEAPDSLRAELAMLLFVPRPLPTRINGDLGIGEGREHRPPPTASRAVVTVTRGECGEGARAHLHHEALGASGFVLNQGALKP